MHIEFLVIHCLINEEYYSFTLTVRILLFSCGAQNKIFLIILFLHSCTKYRFSYQQLIFTYS